MGKKVCEKMLKEIEEIRTMNKEMKDINVMLYAIKNLPVIKTNGAIFRTKQISEDEKEILTNKLLEVFDVLIDYSKLEIEILKDKENKKDKMKVEEIEIKGNYEEAMEQIENADVPKEIKDLVRKQIKKHFNK